MRKKTKSRNKSKVARSGQKANERATEHLHWDFPAAFPHHPGREHGLPENFQDNPADVAIEAICGGIQVAPDGNLGTEQEVDVIDLVEYLISGNTVTFRFQCNYADRNLDDPYQGYATVLVIAEFD